VTGATPPLIVAHRGESHDAPENTLAAFNLAWERGLRAIELDVRLTYDGRLIVCHDADAFRTTGVHRQVADTRLADIKTLDVGAWKGPRWTGESMPTLGEALATVPPGGTCLIEVKVGPEAVPELARAVGACQLKPEQTVVISFHAATLAEVRACMPRVKAHLLSAFRREDDTGEWQPTWDALIAEARRIGAQALNVHVAGPVGRDAVEKVHRAGLDLFVWTVDAVGPALRLAAAGVDGLTSNRAAWLRRTLSAARGRPGPERAD
jgi:glycerophosphoryl diester phosphodiesterase